MKWVVAPLLAAVVLTVSGFMGALQDTTVASVALARRSEEAPRSTAQAARDVGDLPTAARLTGLQAEAFRALSDALQVSARRVATLNDTIAEQIAGLGELRGGLARVGRPLDCVGEQLRALVGTARRVPAGIGELTGHVRALQAAQRKALRHLRSINRKLAALGVVADATGVRAPRPPGSPDAPNTASKVPAGEC